MNSIYQKARWTEEEIEENDDVMDDDEDMEFDDENRYQGTIAFMERELEYHQQIIKKIHLVKQTLKELEKNEILTKEQKEKQMKKIKRSIMYERTPLTSHKDSIRSLKKVLKEKKKIVEEKLKELKKNKELSKEQKEKKQREILNSKFVNWQ